MSIQSFAAVRTAVSRRAAVLPARTLIAMACALAASAAVQAQTPVSKLMVPGGQSAQLAAPEQAPSSRGQVRVIVQFTEPSVLRSRTDLSRSAAAKAEMAQASRSLRSAKAPRLQAISALGGRVQNTLEYSVNAAVVDINPRQIEALRKIPGVKLVELAGVYRMSSVTSPPTIPELLGTLPLNLAGNGGQGVAIAVIDSGVDYTHASFGGPGTVAYYQGAVAGAGPTTIGDTPNVFPNGPRVKGGYDWLGDTWGIVNNAVVGTVSPDPDPIDNKQVSTDFAGHGTESASAAAGSAVPAGGLQPGSAPDAFILAYRGCSRISSACEGSALLNSVDSVVKYAMGMPNDGQTGANNPPLPEGTRFVINMSLGASYGNPLTDDLSEASRMAVRAGVTVVASAGNSNDIPFIVGTPSATDTVISVAASEPALVTGPSVAIGAPLNKTYPIIAGSFGVPFTSAYTAALGFGGANTTVGNNTNTACNPPLNAPVPALPAGTIGIADRGACGFSDKALNVQNAGAAASLIVNNAAGAGPIGMAATPTSAPFVTTASYSMGTADGLELRNTLSTNPGLQATISPLGNLANTIGTLNLVDQISGFSSRGPSQAGRAMKPDITAPGTNIWMADVGTGFGGNSSSGTSFSGPLTAGVAALVLSAKPSFAPWQVKAAMMNTAETNVFASKSAGTLAGLTRMGAGRVQADRAAATGTLAYDAENIARPGDPAYYNTAVSFGQQAFFTPGTSTVSRTVTVQNLGSSPKTYEISVAARFAADLARGMAFTTSASTLTVPGNSTGSFELIGTATASQLPTSGGFPSKLTNLDTCTTATNPPGPNLTCTTKFDDLEQDGFVTISAGSNDTVRVPYLMYPRLASAVSVGARSSSSTAGAISLRNGGAGTTSVDIFNLIGSEDAEDQPAAVAGTEVLPVDLRALGVRYLPGAIAAPPAGVTSGDLIQFAVTLWKPVTTLRPAVFNIEIDTNGDGATDFTVRNLNTTANRSSDFIVPAATGTPGNAFFSTDFTLDTSKAVLTVFPSVMGITATSRIGVRVTSSNFNNGPVLDKLPNSNAFQYIKLNQLVAAPATNSLVMSTGQAAQVPYTINSANSLSAVSPGNKGLLVLVAENPLPSESLVLQLAR